MPEVKDSLVKLVQRGDEGAFEQIFIEFQPKLFRFLWHMLQSEEAANDLIQNIFLKIWKNRHSWQPGASISSYLYRAAKNAALNYQRDLQKGRFEEITDKQESGERTSALAENNEMQERIKKCIDALPAGCRSVFVLSRYEDSKYREIAEKLDISPRTVENQMGRALRLLRECLRPIMR